MTFHAQTWAVRQTALGDEAEAIFEQVWPTAWTRYGLCRPDIRVDMLPAMIRYTPDYLTSFGLVEVQGFGRDGYVKLKVDKWDALKVWDCYHPVSLFLWDRTNRRHSTTPLADLNQLLHHHGEDGMFPEGKPYIALAGNHVPNWTEHVATN